MYKTIMGKQTSSGQEMKMMVQRSEKSDSKSLRKQAKQKKKKGKADNTATTKMC